MDSHLLGDCLRRLIRHVDVERIALTGGVAIGIHVDATRGDRTRSLAAEDIDFVADDVGAVRQTVMEDFLLSHFHLPQPDYPKFMIQLVDPAARLRLDFFRDALGALSRAPVLLVAGLPLRVAGAHDILDHKLVLLSEASESGPVDEKHYADARQLGAICGRGVPPVAASHLTRTAYSRDTGQTCLRCQSSERGGFRLASKRAIFDILGYV